MRRTDSQFPFRTAGAGLIIAAAGWLWADLATDSYGPALTTSSRSSSNLPDCRVLIRESVGLLTAGYSDGRVWGAARMCARSPCLPMRLRYSTGPALVAPNQ